MVRPIVTEAAEAVYAALGPLTERDAEFDWPLLRWVASFADLLQPVDDRARDTADGPGWSQVVDIERAPPEMLAWLAQFVGVRIPPGLSVERQRAHAADAAGFRRGTPTALIAAARSRLTGRQQVILVERHNGDPYRVLVQTFLPETPDPDAVSAALRAEKPGGVVLTYEVIPGSTWGSFAANHATWDAVVATFPTWTSVLFYMPPAV